MSRNELARRVGISGPSMFAIEHGRTKKIKADTLVRLAAALGVPMQEIIKVEPGRGGTEMAVEALQLFARLDKTSQEAMLVALRALAAKKSS